MARQNILINLYGLLTYAYPRTYRGVYREEMIQLFTDVLTTAHGPQEKLHVVLHTLIDTCTSVCREHFLATEASFAGIPAYIKTSSFAGYGLVGPFFLVFIYNYVAIRTHRYSAVIGYIETRTWHIYSVVLPCIALASTIGAILWWLYHDERHVLHQSIFAAIQNFWHSWIPLLIGISTLALIAIF